MKKHLSKILLLFIIIVPVIIFAGCNSNKSTYTVTFMKAHNPSATYQTFSVNKTIEIEKNQVIGTENEPDTRYSSLYRFVGWFTDKNFNYQWDLSKDEVKSNITLYPKYERK